MAARPILTLSTSDGGGGAEVIAKQLHDGYGARGLATAMVVARSQRPNPGVVELRQQASVWRRGFWKASTVLDGLGPAGRIGGEMARFVGSPAWGFDRWSGREAFAYPESYRLLELVSPTPRLVHAHNLHGGYFDLRALPALSRRVPFFLTLHDEWLLTGHCAYTLGCERWGGGCGSCPDLGTYPAVTRDRTAENWRTKQETLTKSTFHVAAPARWLLDRAERSMLGPTARSFRHIPNGVDTSIFTSGPGVEARERLGLPLNRPIVMFAAADHASRFKDTATLRAAIERLGNQGRDLLALALGGSGPETALGKATWRPVPFVRDRARMRDFYVAADLYCHAAKAEIFPNTILEAMACGRPVVATAVGGIPEQVRSLAPTPHVPGHDPSQATGQLVPAGDGAAFAHAVESLLAAPTLAQRLGENARRWVEDEFTLGRQVSRYLEWFDDLAPEERGP